MTSLIMINLRVRQRNARMHPVSTRLRQRRAGLAKALSSFAFNRALNGSLAVSGGQYGRI